MNQPWIYMCSPSWSPLPPPSPSHPSGSSQCTSPEHLSHASNRGWWSVSPFIVYLFQCYSLRTSHPRLLPQIPKSVLYICVSFSVLHIGLLLPSFKILYICVSIQHLCKLTWLETPIEWRLGLFHLPYGSSWELGGRNIREQLYENRTEIAFWGLKNQTPSWKKN